MNNSITKDWVYRQQHHGMNKGELIASWIAFACLSYFIIRSVLTLI
jgi:hypothetical protein